MELNPVLEGKVGLCIEYGYHLYGGENDSNHWFCDPGTPQNCAKIIPCSAMPTNKTDKAALNDVLERFVKAHQNRSVTKFFREDNWQTLFPSLKGQASLLSRLQKGDVVFRSVKNQNGHVVFMAEPTRVHGVQGEALPANLVLEVDL